MTGPIGVTQYIHNGAANGSQIVTTLCGEHTLFTNVSQAARDITCPTCLGLMILRDPLSVLDDQEVKVIRAIRRCKNGDDVGIQIQWQGGFVHVHRILRSNNVK